MPSGAPFEITAELLNDFYAECDEHLRTIRQTLSDLESCPAEQSITPLLEVLFRSFHSLKGNAGIVGLRGVEDLSHRTEDYLKALTKSPAELDEAGLNLLMGSTQKLEGVIAAHHQGAAPPDFQALLQKLEESVRAIQRSPAEAAPAPSRSDSQSAALADKVKAALQSGLSLWRFSFTPSPSLDQRGVNIQSVRQGFNESGEILESKPVIAGAGAIRFQFIVALRQPPSETAGWESKAVTYEPYQVEVPPAPAPASSVPHAASSSAHTPFVAPSHVVRVDLSRLDDLMRIAGEMVMHRARFEEQMDRVAIRHPEVDTQGLTEVQKSLATHLKELREAIMRVRMVPISEIFGRMPFSVRDLAQETGKNVRVRMSGQETEIDKYVVERIKDPMLHLVRNAVSHGIESPEQRLITGKPAEAFIRLSAKTVGDLVVIDVEDDGCGIDPEAVRRKAVERGLRVPAEFDNIALLEVLCTPGFSTRDEADRSAGRGMGMSVVSETLRELGGSLSLHSRPGEGTKFTLRMPLTLSVADAMIVKAGEQNFAIPQSAIEEIVPLDADKVQGIENARLLLHRGKALPLYSLDTFFGFTSPARKQAPVLIMETERGRIGLLVHRVSGQREVVVRSLTDPLLQVPGVSGATELGDGRPVLILEVEGMLRAYKHKERLDRTRKLAAELA